MPKWVRGQSLLSVTRDRATTISIFHFLPLQVNQNQCTYHIPTIESTYVDDRANNAVVVINPEDPTKLSTVITDVCQGIFHQWSNDNTLVIACDISNTVAVINLEDNAIKTSINLLDQGDKSISVMQKPHDIVITPSGDAIFVSILATDGAATDAIIKIDTDTNTVVSRIGIPSGTVLTLVCLHRLRICCTLLSKNLALWLFTAEMI